MPWPRGCGGQWAEAERERDGDALSRAGRTPTGAADIDASRRSALGRDRPAARSFARRARSGCCGYWCLSQEQMSSGLPGRAAKVIPAFLAGPADVRNGRYRSPQHSSSRRRPGSSPSWRIARKALDSGLRWNDEHQGLGTRRKLAPLVPARPSRAGVRGSRGSASRRLRPAPLTPPCANSHSPAASPDLRTASCFRRHRRCRCPAALHPGLR
jgi:hypothetical protein